MLEIGQVIDGKYEIVSVLGKGGMGTVYKALNTKVGNYWAIKQLKSREDLEQEVSILRHLKHQGLPLIVDVFRIGEYWYLIEEFVEGAPLDKVITMNKSIEESILIDWAKQLCDILSYLHSRKPKPIIYQDMKPANLIINKNGIIKIIDFGISSLHDNSVNKSGLGTKGYAAPEQYIDSKMKIDPRTDIYGLGATLYTLATGNMPQEIHKNVEELLSKKASSEGFKYVIKKCVRYNPNERYRNVESLLSDIENIQTLNKKLNKSGIKTVARNLIIGIIIFIILNAVIFSIYDIQESKNNEYLKLVSKSTEYYSQGKVLLSEKSLKEAINLDPNKQEAYEELFELYLSQERYLDILEFIEKAKSNIEFNSDILHLVGLAYFNLGDYDMAVERYRKALEEDSNSDNVKVDISVALARLGKINEAESILEDIDVEESQEGLLHYLHSEVALTKQEYSDAISHLEEAIKIDRDNERYYMLMSYIHRTSGNYDDEIEILTQAIDKCAESSGFSLFELLGDAYQRKADLGKDSSDLLDKSLESYMEIIDNGFEYPAIHMKIGRIYRKKEEFMEAENHYQKALDLDSEYSTAYIQLGYLYIEMENEKNTKKKNYDAAIQYLRTGISLNPNSQQAKKAEETLNLLERGE